MIVSTCTAKRPGQSSRALQQNIGWIRRPAPTGARTMTGQEVPGDGLPVSPVPRPASLGISEVQSSRWVSNIAADHDLGVKVRRRVQVDCGPKASGKGTSPGSAVVGRGVYAGV